MQQINNIRGKENPLFCRNEKIKKHFMTFVPRFYKYNNNDDDDDDDNNNNKSLRPKILRSAIDP